MSRYALFSLRSRALCALLCCAVSCRTALVAHRSIPQPARDTGPRTAATDAAINVMDAAADAIAREAQWRTFAVYEFWFEAPDTIVSHAVPVIDSIAYEFEVEGVVITTEPSTEDVREARRRSEPIVLGDRTAQLETIEGSNGGLLVLRWENATRRGLGRRVVVLDLSPTELSLRWHTERERTTARRIAESLRFSRAPPYARTASMSDAGDVDASEH